MVNNIMKLTEKQTKLFYFVQEKHKSQLRKYTNEPYHTHPFAVAELVSQYTNNCIEIALCHDLFEDTDCTYIELFREMVSIGYAKSYSSAVCFCVNELTDIYTKEAFPELNRKARKELETKRLGTISPRSQNVKYADLIHNTISIVEHDKNFAKFYLKEKAQILEVMVNGNSDLLTKCLKSLTDSKIKLSKNRKNLINLSTCEKGDILISCLGAKLVYIRPTKGDEYLDHLVQYTDNNTDPQLNNSFGSRTNDGFVFKHNRYPTDHNIVEIIKQK